MPSLNNYGGETLDLICEFKLPYDEIQNETLGRIALRDGSDEIFKLAQQHRMPIVVLSAGIKNVIDIVLGDKGLTASAVVANELLIQDGVVNGWKREALVHMQGKNEKHYSDIAHLRHTHPNAIVLGDLPGDTTMVADEDAKTVLRVCVLEMRDDERHLRDVMLQKSLESGYDLVVEHTLEPVVSLLEGISSKRYGDISSAAAIHS